MLLGTHIYTYLLTLGMYSLSDDHVSIGIHMFFVNTIVGRRLLWLFEMFTTVLLSVFATTSVFRYILYTNANIQAILFTKNAIRSHLPKCSEFFVLDHPNEISINLALLSDTRWWVPGSVNIDVDRRFSGRKNPSMPIKSISSI